MESDLISYCAWCNRRKDRFNQAVGPLVPKAQQIGTHGICNACHREMEQEIASLNKAESSFYEWLSKRIKA